MLHEARQDQVAAGPDQGSEARRQLAQGAGKDVRYQDVHPLRQRFRRGVEHDAILDAVGFGVIARGDQRLRVDVETMSLGGAQLDARHGKHTRPTAVVDEPCPRERT